MEKQLLLILLLIFTLSATFAQKLNYVQGEIMVKPRTGVDIRQWTKQYQTFAGKKTNIRVKELVSEPMNIWLLQFDFTRVAENALLAAMRKDKSLEIAQLNHRVELRSTLPNDAQINMQWQYLNVGQTGGLPNADTDADLAWDVTTGGVTPTGDTIVVCVIDDGLSENHPDFGDNIWVNHAEIPDNNMDDDGNGFIDDYFGWNTTLNNDDVFGRANHGTPVAGIIGAQGNNGIGVTGVNWDVKMMIIKGGTGVESEVIEAYSYPLAMRRKYNQTNGQEGAFVVATNSSWGASFLFPEDAPLWCAMYDSLGTQGILNAGATANLDVSVDISGDLPSTCPSDYLITVTNLTDEGFLYKEAGYGVKNVDLGAFGEEVWTIEAPDSYGTFGGTSAATPHVAGTIALLYSAPCAGFASLYKSDPKAAALLIRQYILEGVKYNVNLQGITTTWGQLNINNSMQLLLNACSDCFPPTSVGVEDVTDAKAILSWVSNESIDRVDLRWRLFGDESWTEITNVSSPYELNNLLACSDYEFQLRAFCGQEMLDYSSSVIFQTDGCCEAPEGLTVAGIGSEIANFRWTSVLLAESYTIRYRPEKTETWITRTTTNTSLVVNGLQQCTNYEIQLNTICSGEPSEFSDSFFYQTSGCGACLDLNYCQPRNLNADEEWIARVKLHTLENNSVSDNGYGDYTGMDAPSLTIGDEYTLELRPGFQSISYTEYFTVWIDYNQNGMFDFQERIYEEGANASLFQDTILIPENALPGITRMRVAMQFLGAGGPCSFNSDSGGEVEDYCVEIKARTTSTQNGIAPKDISMNLYPNPFAEQVQVELQLQESQEQIRLRIFNSMGQPVYMQMEKNVATGLQRYDLELSALPAGVYWLECRLHDGSRLTKKMVKTIP